MRYLYLLALTAILFACDEKRWAQGLSNYSAQIGLSNGAGGTGFFVKTSDRIFLVSCYHIFMSCDTWHKTTLSNPADELWCSYKGSKTDGAIKIPLKTLRTSNLPIYGYERADVWAQDVTISVIDNPPANMLQLDFPDTFSAKQLYTFGFHQKEKKFLSIKQASNPGDMGIMMFGSGPHNVFNSYIASPATTGGFSGAPVFYRDSISGEAVFAGLVSSHIAGKPVSIIINPAEVRKEIERALVR